MKVLHITNELTKKNFSIASLMLFVSKHLYNIYNFNYSILTSKIESNLFNDKNIVKIEINNWIDFFLELRIYQLMLIILPLFIFMVFGLQFKFFLFYCAI